MGGGQWNPFLLIQEIKYCQILKRDPTDCSRWDDGQSAVLRGPSTQHKEFVIPMSPEVAEWVVISGIFFGFSVEF